MVEPDPYDRDLAGDAFAHEAPFRPRKNPAKRWWIIAIVVASLSILVGVGLVRFGTTGIANWLGIPVGQVESPLDFANVKNERRVSGQGRQLIQVTGEIINPTDSEQYVPDIVVEVRDAQDRKTYGWEFEPPARHIGPGGKLPFSQGSAAPANMTGKIGLTFKPPSRD